VSSKVLKDVIKRSGVVDAVIDAAANADRSQLSRKNKAAVGNRKRDFINVPKLEDAVLAGTRRSNDCTLIITEGDSAKSLAVAGFEVVGRDT
jgi:DNA topoisomerase-2